MGKDELEKRYTDQLETLRSEISSKLPVDADAARDFLEQNDLDKLLVKFVILKEATPSRLAEFDSQDLIEELLANPELMKQMLLADGAKDGRYGQAMRIYKEIQEHRQCNSEDDPSGVLDRLGLAVSLEHATPHIQRNPEEPPEDAEEFVDPVKRYLNYENAFLEGELDPAFECLTTWELRFVVDGEEPDETIAWGRSMLRNFRPDHIFMKSEEWRYVMLVRSEVRYGGQDVKYDRPDLQFYQNILMNGGICGRRAFIGRFILRAFGIPTTARPSRGHGALCHWTLNHGWKVNLGGNWGAGWTKTLYRKDVDFLDTTKARKDKEGYWKVKRAQWIGDVLDETRVYGAHDKAKPGFWYGLSLKTQQAIIGAQRKVPAVEPINGKSTMAQRALQSPVQPGAKKVCYKDDGEIVIPAAGYANPGRTKDVHVMTSFRGGLQIYLPPFKAQGKTIMRGGTWKQDADGCSSGARLLSGGYGKYHDWGFRVALAGGGGDSTCRSKEMTLELPDTDQCIELVYINPGEFVMGGENTSDGRFSCVEVPKHKVQITTGYYLGKYPVTQAQYKAIMGTNPSKSTKAPDCPVDNIGENDALEFCNKVTEVAGRDVRLPTEAEWEYACRAGGGDTKWFFGDDPADLGEYAWIKDNSGGKSHPVGQKKPNPFGIYDMYGNVCERISDKYAKDYYAKSPATNPTGPSAGIKSSFVYKVKVPNSGRYSLTARIVTVNFNQRLNVAVNGCEIAMKLPFTCGDWKECEPVELVLKQGENMIKFWRDQPPQYGLVVKDFTLKRAN